VTKPTLVDSNVVLDVLTQDAGWFAWSSNALERARNESVLVLCPIVYAEASVRFESIEEFSDVLASDYSLEHPPWEAMFLAGKVFKSYRERGGPRGSVLPDFFVGAHAAVRGYRLLTRDARRYRTYFPTVQLIAP
jgi:predicted nucleic acid-binding protein